VNHKLQGLCRGGLIDEDFLHHRADDRLAQFHRTMRTVPHLRKPLPKIQNGGPFAVRQSPLGLRQRGQGRRHRVNLFELGVPAPFKFRRHQAIPRIDLVVLLKGALRFILELRQLVLKGLALFVLTLIDTLNGIVSRPNLLS
jgi:hypothetical protein